jgi:ABC-type dipeptide/oligopeptide/nickel transport system permease subunit
MTRTLGLILLGGVALGLAAAPVLAPNDPAYPFAGKANAPPMPLRVMADGELRRPFVYPVSVVAPLERRFEEHRDRPVELVFFTGGRVISSPSVPWLPLGGDPMGRDLFSRLLWGGRWREASPGSPAVRPTGSSCRSPTSRSCCRSSTSS